MSIEVTFGQLITLAGFFLAILGVIGKLLINQMQQSISDSLKLISDRMEAIEASNSEEKEQWKQVERELNDLQKELPLHYVRREDHIRHQTILETKIDALATKLENVQLRQLVGGKHES